MNRQKIQALIRVLERIYNAESLEQFPSTVSSALNEIIDEDALFLSLVAPHVALAHRNLQRLESLREAVARVVPEPEDLERVGLTPREAEVLHWVMKGKQDGVIADILRISVRTVHQHVGRILRKLQSESRASASYEAMIKLKALTNHRPSCVAA